MKNYVESGERAELTLPYDVAGGAGFLVGATFAVATGAGVSGAKMIGMLSGTFDLAKEPSLVIAEGARVFWDNTNKRITTTSTSNYAVGRAVKAAAGADTTVRVRLGATLPAGT